jgi:hypothetical protein
MSLSQTKTIVANQVAYACKQELYGLHFKNKVQWSKLTIKTLVLKAIDDNTVTGYYTTAQINQMLAKISNPNINL